MTPSIPFVTGRPGAQRPRSHRHMPRRSGPSKPVARGISGRGHEFDEQLLSERSVRELDGSADGLVRRNRVRSGRSTWRRPGTRVLLSFARLLKSKNSANQLNTPCIARLARGAGLPILGAFQGRRHEPLIVRYSHSCSLEALVRRCASYLPVLLSKLQTNIRVAGFPDRVAT